MEDPHYQDHNLQQWAQSFQPYEEFSLFKLQRSEKTITLVIGDFKKDTYESLSFARENNSYSFGYRGLPAAARSTLNSIHPTAREDIALGLEDAIRENEDIEDPCLFVGYGREGSVDELRAELDILTNALLRKLLN